jgi:oligosaccharyltransferase complex subunit epsilon
MAGPKSSSKPSPTSSEKSVAVSTLWKSYIDQTPDRLKFIDAFLAFIVLSGVLQFVYCVLVTNFPFNAFLAG